MKVSNMVNSNGNPVPNQFIISIGSLEYFKEYGKPGSVEYFQSYKTLVAKRENGRITIDKNNPFSMTTSKYLYRFLNVTDKEFKANVKSGKYQIADLNC
jgi:hypothetical protein